MKTIKAIIVDDEADARDVLASLIQLSKQPINIIAECSNLKAAVDKIKELKPDVVFLDIQMPEFAGYEIVNFFDEINFEIVFVTAYDKYALKAFELSAIDYLVKPIKRTRLNDTLKRIVEKTDEKNTVLEYETLLESLQNKKFKIGDIVFKPSDSEGNILAMMIDSVEVKEGDFAPEGTEIQLVVGGGLTGNKIATPCLIGKTFDEVSFVLSSSDLNIGYVNHGKDGLIDTASSVIYKQKPNPYEAIRVGEAIDIFLIQELPYDINKCESDSL